MVEFTLPANSKVTEGQVFKAKSPPKKPRNFKVYRWNPDDGKNPRVDMLIWFLIRDQKSTGSLASGWQSGLAYVNGNKKPIWNVFSSLAESQ